MAQLSKEPLKKVAGIILAAGKSTRMGRLKQLLLIDQRPLITIVVENALASKLDIVTLVLGFQAERIKTALGPFICQKRLKVIVNREFEKGLSSSLIVGLRSIENTHDAVMFILGDQPLVAPHHINAIIDRYNSSDADICFPDYGEKHGNPVLFDRRLYSELTQLHGDKGGRILLQKQGVRIIGVNIEDIGQNLDIDTEADLKRVLRSYKDSS